MKSFHEFLQEVYQETPELRKDIEVLAAKLTHMRPQDVEDLKDSLLSLREVLEDKLTGA